jgi:hypothetical protein
MLDGAWLREVRERAIRDESLCLNDHVVRREVTDSGSVFTVSCGATDIEAFQVPFGTIDSHIQNRLRHIAETHQRRAAGAVVLRLVDSYNELLVGPPT